MSKRLLLFAAVLLLAIPLAYLLGDLAREVVAGLWRMVWVVRILFEALPQIPLWVLFLLFVLYLALRSLRPSETSSEKVSRSMVDRPGRVYDLSKRIEDSTEGEYARRSLARLVKNLTIEALGHQHRTGVEQTRRQLEAGILNVPPEVQEYLQSAESLFKARSGGLLSRLRGRLSLGAPSRTTDAELEQVVEFLESQLRIDPDHLS